MNTPVPHWAGSMVANYRAAAKVPAAISDGALFATLQVAFTDGMDQEEILETVRAIVAMEALLDRAGEAYALEMEAVA